MHQECPSGSSFRSANISLTLRCNNISSSSWERESSENDNRQTAAAGSGSAGRTACAAGAAHSRQRDVAAGRRLGGGHQPGEVDGRAEGVPRRSALTLTLTLTLTSAREQVSSSPTADLHSICHTLPWLYRRPLWIYVEHPHSSTRIRCRLLTCGGGWRSNLTAKKPSGLQGEAE